MGENISICFVSLGATTNDVIQVRKVSQDSSILTSDKYNYLRSIKLLTGTSSRLV